MFRALVTLETGFSEQTDLMDKENLDITDTTEETNEENNITEEFETVDIFADEQSGQESDSSSKSALKAKAGILWNKITRIFKKVTGAVSAFAGKIKEIALKISAFYKKRTIPILICALSVLIVVLIFVLLLGAGAEEETMTKYQKWMQQLRTKDIAVCQIDTINDFFDEYYYAMSEGNTTALEGMYDDPEGADITTELSAIVESYSDITVYVTPGINSGEVLAFVSYDINFVNIESAAPAVDSFYIMMDEEQNSIYILTAMYTDTDINTFMYLASYREPIRSLLTDTESELNSILEADSELRNIYIIMNAMAEENSNEDGEEASQDTQESETSEEDTSEGDESSSEDETVQEGD